MGENKIRLREVIILGGAYISYGVGASFGTGISLLQYHGALGVWGILSQLISCVLTITLIYVVSKDCGTYHLHSMDGMFSHYCGKYLGTIFRKQGIQSCIMRETCGHSIIWQKIRTCCRKSPHLS